MSEEKNQKEAMNPDIKMSFSDFSPKPIIGRIVYWKSVHGEIYPAIITAVHSDECVNLGIFTNVYWTETSVLRGDGPRKWQWPTRNF